ncbi:MAG TPA: ATP-binding cassette domain-containing protein [Gemmatales bacterium]|nr:ATP-binding cassette domain-containing protein [Gemmatales bacterium]HMP17627.1 ATP-binding cassette domain-containing protein [Gemmatales bacterium]
MADDFIAVHVVHTYAATSEELRYEINIPLEKVTAVVGRSGSGKTTLLRLLSGLEKISKGQIDWPVTLANHSLKTGMVFQHPTLIPHLNVLDNLAIGWKLCYYNASKLWWARSESSELRQRLDETIPLLELEPYLQRLPSELSGGQQQRVALGRCMIRRPAVFLLDEPLSHLDPAMAHRIRQRILDCFLRWNSTVVWVTHDREEAQAIATQILSLDSTAAIAKSHNIIEITHERP